MASENETVAAVAAEMRGETYPVSQTPNIRMREYADRIEAAHRREVAELYECLKEAVSLHCADLNEDCLHCHQIGVCSFYKWRKALEATKGAEDAKG